jgi:hypothetical protein
MEGSDSVDTSRRRRTRLIDRRASRVGRPVIAALFAVVLATSLLAPTIAAAGPGASDEPSPTTEPSLTPDVLPSAEPAPSVDVSPPFESSPSLDPSPVVEPPPTDRPATKGKPTDAQAAPAATPTPTTVSFGSASHVGTKGYQQSFYVAVEPAPDGGTVDLLDGGTIIDSTGVPSGYGLFQWTPTTVGTHQLTLSYSGTPSFAPSVSPQWYVDVAKAPPTSVDIVASANPVQRNADVTFTATVVPNPGPGSIEFAVPDGVLATVALDDGGQAQYTTSFATAGIGQIEATFTGNAEWTAKESGWYPEQVTGDTVQIVLTVPSNPMLPGDVTVTATVTPNPGGGSVRFDAPYPVPDTIVPLDGAGQAVLDLGTYGPTYISVGAEFLGTEIYGTATTGLIVNVWGTTAVSLVANRSTATVGELPVILTATVTSASGPADQNVTFLDDVGGVVVVLGPVSVDPYYAKATFSSSALRVGVHSIRAHYEPGAAAGAFDSLSDPITVTVAADTAVHTTFAPSLATFYPYKDLFRDMVALRGVLDERATVTMKIYSSTGSLKRTLSLGTKGPGAYAANWNGRTATGTAVAAGKYKVVASFKDARGNTRKFVAYTTVSWRRVVWKSVTVLKNADVGTYYVAGGGAIYYSPDYAHGRILDTGDMIRDCVGCAWAGGKFVIAVASTALDYRSMYLEIRGHGFSDRDHTGEMSIVNPKTLALELSMPPGMYDEVGTTWGTPLTKAYISSTHRITAWVTMTQAWGDAYDLRYLRLTYKYAVWA